MISFKVDSWYLERAVRLIKSSIGSENSASQGTTNVKVTLREDSEEALFETSDCYLFSGVEVPAFDLQGVSGVVKIAVEPKFLRLAKMLEGETLIEIDLDDNTFGMYNNGLKAFLRLADADTIPSPSDSEEEEFSLNVEVFKEAFDFCKVYSKSESSDIEITDIGMCSGGFSRLGVFQPGSEFSELDTLSIPMLSHKLVSSFLSLVSGEEVCIRRGRGCVILKAGDMYIGYRPGPSKFVGLAELVDKMDSEYGYLASLVTEDIHKAVARLCVVLDNNQDPVEIRGGSGEFIMSVRSANGKVSEEAIPAKGSADGMKFSCRASFLEDLSSFKSDRLLLAVDESVMRVSGDGDGGSMKCFLALLSGLKSVNSE